MSESRSRDVRPVIYAVVCAALAVVYFVVFRRLIPSTHASTQAIAYTTMAVMVVIAAATIARTRWSWWIAIGGCAYMLAVTVALIVLLVHSAAFLAGVYGAFGRGAASMAYLAAALVIEAVGLVPALLLKFLRTRAGRRCFGVPPRRPRAHA